ncbi:uncharacterized protein LOC116351257 [Contarinia nasturtii]|uniref:uncharacterized protein LOC116351257 n=1 Tax=Contarinia nasturtii TaxID=265458 RepID=UPI0012D43600|nr:uncharacterized protein LOC116351257 [Contarinia nasturtii]
MILYSKKDMKTHAASALVTYLRDAIDSIQSCIECYMNALNHPNDWFTMVCDEPHLLVWAKMKGYPYWPVKLMRVDEQKVLIRFFEDHQNAKIMAKKNCFLYSHTNPAPLGYISIAYKSALNEANTYLTNIQQKFGAYNLATSTTPLNVNLINKYIVDFVPGIVRHRESKRSNHTKRKINDTHFATFINALNLMPSDDHTPNPKRSRFNEAEIPHPSTINGDNRSTHVLSIKKTDENNDYTEPVLQTVMNEPIPNFVGGELEDSVNVSNTEEMNVTISPHIPTATVEPLQQCAADKRSEKYAQDLLYLKKYTESEERCQQLTKKMNDLKLCHEIEIKAIDEHNKRLILQAEQRELALQNQLLTARNQYQLTIGQMKEDYNHTITALRNENKRLRHQLFEST